MVDEAGHDAAMERAERRQELIADRHARDQTPRRHLDEADAEVAGKAGHRRARADEGLGDRCIELREGRGPRHASLPRQRMVQCARPRFSR